jgi:hypothetical protein
LDREEMRLRLSEVITLTEESHYLDLNKTDNVNRLKFCLAGAFCNTLVQANPVINKQIESEKNAICCKGFDPKKVLVIETKNVYDLFKYSEMELEIIKNNIKIAF